MRPSDWTKQTRLTVGHWIMPRSVILYLTMLWYLWSRLTQTYFDWSISVKIQTISLTFQLYEGSTVQVLFSPDILLLAKSYVNCSPSQGLLFIHNANLYVKFPRTYRACSCGMWNVGKTQQAAWEECGEVYIARATSCSW